MGYGTRFSGYGLRITGFFLLFLFFFVFSPFPASRYPFPASADSITIRTIVTPIGSQSEKWGAKGLMVCVGGEAISDGGCGESDYKGTSKITTSTGGTIEIIQDSCPGDADCGKVFLFIDENDDHKFDSGDTVYEVRGGGGETGCKMYAGCSDAIVKWPMDPRLTWGDLYPDAVADGYNLFDCVARRTIVESDINYTKGGWCAEYSGCSMITLKAYSPSTTTIWGSDALDGGKCYSYICAGILCCKTSP